MSKILARSVLAAALVGAAVSAFALDISGAGATFPYPVYSKWADTYKKETGNGLNYQSIGSGGGIKQIIANTVTFGATDAPLKPEELETDGLCNGRRSWAASCRSSISTASRRARWCSTVRPSPKSSSARSQTWNDPAIKKLNPTVKLPDRSRSPSCIARTVRAPRFNFTDYLSKVSRRLEVQGRRGDGGRMAGRHRRQGQ